VSPLNASLRNRRTNDHDVKMTLGRVAVFSDGMRSHEEKKFISPSRSFEN
jgi:hypothetical protein